MRTLRLSPSVICHPHELDLTIRGPAQQDPGQLPTQIESVVPHVHSSCVVSLTLFQISVTSLVLVESCAMPVAPSEADTPHVLPTPNKTHP